MSCITNSKMKKTFHTRCLIQQQVLSISGYFRTALSKIQKFAIAILKNLSFSKTFRVLKNCVINFHNFPKPVRSLPVTKALVKRFQHFTDSVQHSYSVKCWIRLTNCCTVLSAARCCSALFDGNQKCWENNRKFLLSEVFI